MLPSSPQPSWSADDTVRLRPWRATDLTAVRAAHRCPDIQRWHVRRFDSDDEALAWIARWQIGWRAGTEASWAVIDDAGALLGQVGLRDINGTTATLSVWVVPEARNRGVATRAAQTLSDWTFEQTGIVYLTWHHSVQNEASFRAAEAAGFTADETRRAAGEFADGLHDMHLHLASPATS